MSQLRVIGLDKNFRRRKVVENVSFHVFPAEVVGLLGPNGAGKTTCFNLVVGRVRPDAGEVWMGDTDLTRLPMHRRMRHGMGYLPQEASIFRKMTVRDNFLSVLELEKGLTPKQRREKAALLLEEFGLGAVSESLGESLSGGERRRAEIARSLIPNPQYILFDEPFAGVDPINVRDLQKQIVLLKSRGIGVLITDHNVRDTLKICDRAYIISQGKILEEGVPQQLAQSERAREVYLGSGFRLD